MNQEVTLQISENIWHYAKSVAKKSKRRIEEVLTDWLEKGSSEIEVEKLSDVEVIALAELKMPVKQQKILHNLIARNREGELTTGEKQ